MPNHCPYFAAIDDGQCKMTKGGLYIPRLEHIEEFCKTVRYTNCQQYTRGLKLLQQAMQQEEALENSRRSFPRHPKQLPVVLSACDSKGNPADVIDPAAISLDLSLGGIGVRSSQRLETARLVHLRLFTPTASRHLTGIGEVRWSRPANGDGSYRAGIAFVDRGIPAELRQQLAL